MAKYLRIDPRDFIMKPFITCPRCGQVEFGILSVGPDSFKRRCRGCRLATDYSLPDVHKTIIYLDQFVITNLMHIRSRAEKKVEPFWYDVYDRLVRLSTLQAIVCPASAAHRLESAPATSQKQLQDGYEMLAHDVRFEDFEDIKCAQVLDCLDVWIVGDTTRLCEIHREQVLDGDPDRWIDRHRVSVTLPPIPGYLEALEADLRTTHEGLLGVFQTWKAEPDRTWEYWRDSEGAAWGRAQVKLLQQEAQKREEIRRVKREMLIPFGLTQPPVIRLFDQITNELGQADVPEVEQSRKFIEFMLSENLREAPFIKIASGMYACLAKKASTQQKPPTRGFYSDVDVMSCLLPYCDAMFVDRECCAYWREIQAVERRRLPYATRVFSLATKDEFLAYLDDLEQAVPPIQHQLASEVYG